MKRVLTFIITGLIGTACGDVEQIKLAENATQSSSQTTDTQKTTVGQKKAATQKTTAKGVKVGNKELLTGEIDPVSSSPEIPPAVSPTPTPAAIIINGAADGKICQIEAIDPNQYLSNYNKATVCAKICSANSGTWDGTASTSLWSRSCGCKICN